MAQRRRTHNKSKIRSLDAERARRLRERAKSTPTRASKAKRKAGKFDFTLFLVVLLLMLFGIVMVFSSSYYYALTNSNFNNDMYYFVKRQIMWSGLGICAMIFLMNFPYRIIKNFTFIAYIFAIACLILVLIVGIEGNGSKRWLGIPNTSIGFQPSEVAKIVVILYLSNYISSHKGILGTVKGFIKCCVILFVPVVLIAVENLSTAIVVTGIGVCILFVASPKVWYFFAAAVPVGILGVAAVTMPKFAYRFDRIKYWLDPFSDPTDKGFQIIQSLYAVASGGFFGLGIGQSRQKTYVPEPYNDIIFAIICEELGMFGAAVVILLFAILVCRGIKIAMNAEDTFGSLCATGITALIGIQAIINIAVATNTMPNTGMALPFISYGGSGMVFTLSSMGILLNISRYQRGRE
ncbi:putative lipid II flippase FtsW [Anaerotignum faecicola]|nr:putative lipid II flippase FtsW [Anaerotignum faecicola]